MFLNRRGYAPVLHCGDCGWKSGCPHCSAWRVFHKLDRTLRCHHCGFTERVPRACPDCGNLDIAPIGRGTERLEEQLARAAAAAPRDRAHRRRQHAPQGRARGAARRGACRRGRRAGRHADDRQGPRLPPHHAGGRGQPRQRAVQQRLPRARAAVRAADAGGRAAPGAMPRRPRRSEMWVQTWHPRHPLYAALRAARLRRLRREPAAASAQRPGCRRIRTSRCCAPRRATARGGARLPAAPPPSSPRRCPRRRR